jgi:hypothetical protein
VDAWLTPVTIKTPEVHEDLRTVQNGIAVDDLYSLMSDKLAQAKGDRFHWTKEGAAVQAAAVSEAIGAILEKKKRIVIQGRVNYDEEKAGNLLNPLHPRADVETVAAGFKALSVFSQSPFSQSDRCGNWSRALQGGRPSTAAVPTSIFGPSRRARSFPYSRPDAGGIDLSRNARTSRTTRSTTARSAPLPQRSSPPPK